jgi:hypothetical protein
MKRSAAILASVVAMGVVPSVAAAGTGSTVQVKTQVSTLVHTQRVNTQVVMQRVNNQRVNNQRVNNQRVNTQRVNVAINVQRVTAQRIALLRRIAAQLL